MNKFGGVEIFILQRRVRNRKTRGKMETLNKNALGRGKRLDGAHVSYSRKQDAGDQMMTNKNRRVFWRGRRTKPKGILDTEKVGY